MNYGVFLAEPDLLYKDQFAAMVASYGNTEETHYFDMYKPALEDFEGYLQRLHNNAIGVDVPEDWTTTQTYWLTDASGAILGVIRIRPGNDNEFVRNYAGNIGYDISPLHRKLGYGKAILKLGLEKAKLLGMDRVLITCDFDNIGSIRVIEGNGGVLESEVFCESKDTLLRRYWIQL